jgi:hypothetical protein
MKKQLQSFLLLFTFLVPLVMISNAQSNNVNMVKGLQLTDQQTENVPLVPYQASKDELLLWGENIDVSSSTTGIVSTHLGGISNGLVETADDFVLAEGNWVITRIQARGFKSSGTIDPTQFGIKIYADEDNTPGALVFQEIITATYNSQMQNFVLTQPCALPGGTYWITVYGYYPESTSLSVARWNWNTFATLVGSQTMLRDNPNLFGAGATMWTTLSSLGVANAASTDFAIYGLEQTYTVTFNINDGTIPLEGATVLVESPFEPSIEVVTNEGGVATFELTNGTYNYTISKDGFSTIGAEFSVENQDVSFNLSLTEVIVNHNVTFTVMNGNYPIEGAEVLLASSGEYYFTNASGQASFVLEDGEYEYHVRKTGYQDFSSTFTVDGEDLFIEVELAEVTYNVAFTVTDGTNPLFEATVKVGANEALTNQEGLAELQLPAGSYSYFVSKEGFVTSFGSFEVTNDNVQLGVALVAGTNPTFTVTFTIADGESNPITDAVVTLNDTEANAGEYVFADLEPGLYSYSVAKDGFVSFAGTVTVTDEDVTVPVTLTLVGINTNTFANFSAYPNPFSGTINLSNPAAVSRVYITNIIGQRVMDVATNGAGNVETAALPAGIYLVTFEAASGERTVRKMVKK